MGHLPPSDQVVLTYHYRSGSMTSTDHRPLANSPVTQLVVQRQNNRFGAALTSLFTFCKARDEAVRQGAATGARRDAYSVILFDHQATVRFYLPHLNWCYLCIFSGAIAERFHQHSRANHKSMLKSFGRWYKLQCGSEVCSRRDGDQLEHRKVILFIDNLPVPYISGLAGHP